MKRLVFAATLVAAVGGLVLPGSGAAAQSAPSVVATGWWSRSPVASAPAGGMAVGSAPDGPTSVAAIKLQLGDGVRDAVVVLEEVGATGADFGAIVACAARNDWEPVEQGELEGAPRVDCNASPTTPVTRDSSTLTWSVDLTQLLAGKSGEVSIALIPSFIPQTATAGGVAAFDVQWSGPPTLNATAAPSSTPSVPSSPSPSPSADPAPAAARPASPAPAAARPSSFAVSAPAVPTAVLPASGAAQGATTTVPAVTSTTVPTAVSSGLAGTSSSGGGNADRPIAQAVFFIVVSAIAGTIAGAGRWWATSRRPAGAR